MSNDNYTLIKLLLDDSEKMRYQDGSLDRILKRADMLVKKVFGTASNYTEQIKRIRFSPSFSYGGMDKSIYVQSFENGKSQLINLLNVILEDLNLSIDYSNKNTSNANDLLNTKSDRIFIVHGHNEEMKQSVARFSEKIGFRPIILHEQPNSGKTIIEKFTEYSNVELAIVLLSADDIAFSKDGSVENARPRPRQNVIFEMGYFLGKIGRENVLVLFEESNDLEILSDYLGVLYVPYDINGNWKLSIAKEMKAIGYSIDGNKLIE